MRGRKAEIEKLRKANERERERYQTSRLEWREKTRIKNKKIKNYKGNVNQCPFRSHF